jgi:uncharacterized protein (DUF934 family)
MTEEIKLWQNGQFIVNNWQHCENDNGDGHVILPLSTWLELTDEHRHLGANRIGVLLMPGDELAAVIPFLSQIPLIALAFPVYNDGRSHSKAALLKSRYGYGGDIRAVGDILVDQIPLLLRNGFDSLEIKNPIAILRLEQNISTAVDIFYQPATRPSNPTTTYSWRRVPHA